MKIIRKLIDLPENTVKVLAKEAIDKGTNFKVHAQNILEKAATKVKVSK